MGENEALKAAACKRDSASALMSPPKQAPEIYDYCECLSETCTEERERVLGENRELKQLLKRTLKMSKANHESLKKLKQENRTLKLRFAAEKTSLQQELTAEKDKYENDVWYYPKWSSVSTRLKPTSTTWSLRPLTRDGIKFQMVVSS